MHALDLVTILCAAFMTGNEVAVSLFVNPIVWQLEAPSQAKALRLFAARLGKAMPFWYAASLLLIVIEACLRRHQPAFPWIVAAASIRGQSSSIRYSSCCRSTTASQVSILITCPQDGSSNTVSGTRITARESSC